ncbi:hypothetical protein BGX27_006699, partial [Mortierella sp. AM989]
VIYDDDLGVIDSAARVLDAHYTALENTNIASTASKGEAFKEPEIDRSNLFTLLRSSREVSSYLLKDGFNEDKLETITEVIYDHSWSANIPPPGPMAEGVLGNVMVANKSSFLGVLHKHGKDIKAIVAESLVSRTTLPKSLEELLISALHSDPYSNGPIPASHIMFPLPKSVTSTLF